MSSARAQLLLLLAVLSLANCTPAWQPDSFPDPGKDLKACGRQDIRTGVSRVCDPDEVLSAKSRDTLEGIIQDIETGREPYELMDCRAKGKTGYKVAAAVMRRMAVLPGKDPGEAARLFAKALHDAWGVGDAACNNGVLLLLSIDDREVYISTGAGALNALPGGKIQVILGRMRPQLRAGAYDAAMEQAVIDVGLGLAGADFEEEGHGWFDPVLAAFLALIGGCFGFSWFKNRRKTREYSKCKQLLEKLKAEQQNALRNNQYSTTSCPVCLEDFTPDAATGSVGKSGSKVGSSSGSKADANGGSSKANGGGGSSKSDAASSAPLLNMRQSESGGAAAAADAGEAVRKPLALPCGHRFCEPCISRWVDSSATCPICRQLISDDDAGGSDAAPLRSTEGQQQQAGAGGYQDLFVPDFMFRLNMLQHRYPNYIEPTMVDQWSADVQEGRTFSWDAVRHAQMHDPAVRHQHADMGSAGATTSFGGGSSFGGGGGGSSW